MAIFAPHQINFKTVEKIGAINGALLLALLAVSFIVVLDKIQTYPNLHYWLNFFYFWLIIAYAISDYLLTFYFFPEAENVRRRDFFQNSFGNKFIDDPSVGYFTNDSLPKGVYKMGVNLFENLFFTTAISKEMAKKELLKSAGFSTAFALFAFEGFSRTEKFSLPFLQTFLSITILGGAAKILFFYSKNKALLEKARELFTGIPFKSKPAEYVGYCLKLYADYEANLAWGGILLDGKVYKKLNPILSKQWEKVKSDLGIEEVHG